MRNGAFSTSEMIILGSSRTCCVGSNALRSGMSAAPRCSIHQVCSCRTLSEAIASMLLRSGTPFNLLRLSGGVVEVVPLKIDRICSMAEARNRAPARLLDRRLIGGDVRHRSDRARHGFQAVRDQLRRESERKRSAAIMPQLHEAPGPLETG